MNVRWGVGAALLLAAGCVRLPEAPESTDPAAAARWSQRQASLAAIRGWRIRGRLAVQSPEQAETVSFVWRRDGEQHQIELYGALGGGRVRVTQDRDRATFTDRHGHEVQGPDAETLFYEQSGWRIPFGAIVHWVVGLPVPGEPYEMRLAAEGTIETLNQLGWEVDFRDYDEGIPDLLPLRIFADRIGDAAGGPVKVRLQIKDWGEMIRSGAG